MALHKISSNTCFLCQLQEVENTAGMLVDQGLWKKHLKHLRKNLTVTRAMWKHNEGWIAASVMRSPCCTLGSADFVPFCLQQLARCDLLHFLA